MGAQSLSATVSCFHLSLECSHIAWIRLYDWTHLLLHFLEYRNDGIVKLLSYIFWSHASDEDVRATFAQWRTHGTEHHVRSDSELVSLWYILRCVTGSEEWMIELDC